MGKRTSISGGFCIFLAAALLLLPLKWVIAAAFAAFFHELCHYLAIYLCTREHTQLHLFSFGARLPLPPMSLGKELLCALAGPLGGLTLLLFAPWTPRTAICAAFQSAYNLLPVYPLDGGRAASCLLSICFPPPLAQKAGALMEKICLTALCALSVYAFVALRLGVMPLILAGILIIRVKFAKMPCKVPQLRVQ